MIPAASTFVPTMNPGTSWRKTSGRPNALQRLTKRAALSAESLSRIPPSWRGWLATMPAGRPPKRARHGDRLRPLRLEAQVLAVVDDPADDVLDVVGLPVGLGQDVQQRLVAAVDRIGRLAARRRLAVVRRGVRQVLADARDALLVVGHLEVADAGLAAVHARAAELLLRDVLADRGADEVRAGERHRAPPAHHRHEVREAGDVRGARRARPHERGDLRDDAARDNLLAEEVTGAGEQRADRLLDPRARAV